MQTAQLPRQLVNSILEHAQNSPTQEICGLISSYKNHPVRAYHVANDAPHPERRYSMDPGQQIDAMRTMREQGEELFAIYHSHPDNPASPSDEDLRQAAYLDVLHIIISMSTAGTLQIRGFRFDADSATPVDIIME